MPEQNEPYKEPKERLTGAPQDPTRSSKSLAIALVVAAVFLLIAAGIVVWLLMTPPNPAVAVVNQATDDVRDVKNVTFLPPTDMPAQYAKNDQTKNDQVQVYYYDDATNCGFTLGVSDVAAGKTIKDTVTEAITAAQAQGVTTTDQSDAEAYELHDADNAAITYTFASVNLYQDVKVDGVAFTQQKNTILYKQFGSKVASLSYACKAETWNDKKEELSMLASKFTVKAER